VDEKNGEFLKRLKAMFQIEAGEHVRAITAGLGELERAPAPERNAELVEIVFRETHSLKGAARSVNLKDIESICQPLEGAFSALKRGTIAWSSPLSDLLHQAVETVAQLVSAPDAELSSADRARTRELTRQLGQAAQAGNQFPVASCQLPVAGQESTGNQKPETGNRAAPDPRFPIVGTVRIATTRLDSLLLQAEEMVSFKLAASQRLAELQEISRGLASWQAEARNLESRISNLESPIPDSRLRAWQASNETHSSVLEKQVMAVTRALERDQRTVKRLVDEHLEALKGTLMLPVALLVETLPMVVRDLARDRGKEAELVIRGAEIEIDKRILEELKDPFIHLLRNCVDHGIEKPGERAARGKSARGVITIAFSTSDSRRVEILVSDDGEGIDAALVRAAAIKAGVVTREAAESLDEREALSLIFRSGITTSPIITDVSGRGLGLAIVREKVEKLGGVVTVETRAGAGTTFRMLLPLALATSRGVLVREAEQTFVLPTVNVERIVRVKPAAIRTVENRETIAVAGRVLALARLGAVLDLPIRRKRARPSPTASAAAGLPAHQPAGDHVVAVVLAWADQRIAFQVDEVLDEQQVMVKGLGRQLRRVRNVAGAAVLGSGRVVPVLNIPDLMKSAMRSVAPAQTAAEESPAGKGRVLVAEDSITARALLKNILQAAGYRVTTAVDGADAFTQARGGDFDLVVSDVDMPRMSGFELARKIRGDEKLGGLPVVLVTALESREDRERGVEAGANAYIVKSSFDQSNLLEVVQRLV
jgi:two-component system chemotaxis sensor kinase CheA